MYVQIFKKFNVSKTKCDYLMNYGILPHFRSILLILIQDSPFYSLSFNESLNRVMQSCQMDVDIPCWNETNNTLESEYIDSVFFSHIMQRCFWKKVKEFSNGFPECRLSSHTRIHF